MTIQYTIQKGDTLTKIAQEHYGLKGNAAYSKALELAKENGIKNANLIYAGNTLKLNGTLQEESQQQKVPVDNFATQTEASEENFANKYQELLAKQKTYMQYQAIQATNQQLDKNFQIEEPEYNPEADNHVSFADDEIFNNDISTKVQLYKEAALNLATEHLKAVDKNDANGKKDNQLSFEEFATFEIENNEKIYKNIDMALTRNAFIQSYYTTYGLIPDEATIQDGIQEEMSSIKSLYTQDNTDILAELKEIFDSYDIDKNGALDKTEIATTYIAMDASKGITNETNLKAFGENDELLYALDGNIDFKETLVFCENTLKELHKTFFG